MQLINNTAAAAQSKTFNVNTLVQGDAEFAGKNYPIYSSFQITGGVLGVAEYVALEYQDGSNWRIANIDGNEGKILDSDNAIRTIDGRLINVRLNKSITANAIGVKVV